MMMSLLLLLTVVTIAIGSMTNDHLLPVTEAFSSSSISSFSSSSSSSWSYSVSFNNRNGMNDRDRHRIQHTPTATATNTRLYSSRILTPLPEDISPFTKSSAKRRDVQSEFRKLADRALIQALKDDLTRLELEFPPLIGGDQSKSQFDDFDNVQELNQNRDWCVQLLPSLDSSRSTWSKSSTGSSDSDSDKIWFVLPDLKEVELCKQEWTGQRYRQAARFTSIEAVTAHYASYYSSNNNKSNNKSNTQQQDQGYSKPWGATFASTMNQLLGSMGGGGGSSDNGDDENKSSSSTVTSTSGGGLLGDINALDSLYDDDDDSNTQRLQRPSLHLVCQPGNGGPVEDWINVKTFHELNDGKTPTCIVNGALDKVRDGYYAPFIFPKLAQTFDFYRSFESIFFLKPVSDKGVYGWLFRVYPEPWQVILQRPVKRNINDQQQVEIQDIVALTSETRPTYNECVAALLRQNSKCIEDENDQKTTTTNAAAR